LGKQPAQSPESFRVLASKYDHLYDFDTADAGTKKPLSLTSKDTKATASGEDEQDAHWSQVRHSIDILMGVPQTDKKA
jgi:hypothetical protein